MLSQMTLSLVVVSKRFSLSKVVAYTAKPILKKAALKKQDIRVRFN